MVAPSHVEACRHCGRFVPQHLAESRAVVLKKRGVRGWYCDSCAREIRAKPWLAASLNRGR